MSAPRLATLVAGELVTELTDSLLRHLSTLAFDLSPGIDVRITESDPGAGTLQWTVGQLVTWTQTGEGGDWGPPGDVGTAGCARDALQSVCTALYRYPAADASWSIAPLAASAGEPETALDVLVRAAWARITMDSDEPVPRRCLAALAGITERALKLAVQRGDLKTLRGRKSPRGGQPERDVAPAAARRYLAARVLGPTATALEQTGGRWVYQHDGAGERLLVHGGEMAVGVLATQQGWTQRGRWWVASAR